MSMGPADQQDVTPFRVHAGPPHLTAVIAAASITVLPPRGQGNAQTVQIPAGSDNSPMWIYVWPSNVGTAQHISVARKATVLPTIVALSHGNSQLADVLSDVDTARLRMMLWTPHPIRYHAAGEAATDHSTDPHAAHGPWIRITIDDLLHHSTLCRRHHYSTYLATPTPGPLVERVDLPEHLAPACSPTQLYPAAQRPVTSHDPRPGEEGVGVDRPHGPTQA